MPAAHDLTIRNAQMVLPGGVVRGCLQCSGGTIKAIDEGPSNVGEDFDGDFLVPGLVELHTDHIESHYAPRPGVRWNMTAAIQAHDAQVAAAGITTVFDCLRMGRDDSYTFEAGEMRNLALSLEQAGAQDRLRSEHFLHLRCEVSAPDVLDEFAAFESDPRMRLVSLMDHAPGQRQFQDLSVFKGYYGSKAGRDRTTFNAFVQRRMEQSQRYARPHREKLSGICRERGVTLASHDDATGEHVSEALELGVCLSEFPTTSVAAKEARISGLHILMGAPNVVRGQSHSGNLAARDLAEQCLLDVMSSDYVPNSLLYAAFVLSEQERVMTLPAAIKLVTANPAALVGLTDRGRLDNGYRADLLRVHYNDGVPLVRAVWRQGRRVA